MAVRHLVIEATETPEGDRCVDVFCRADGTFGFAEYRRDVEDLRGWFAIGRHGGRLIRPVKTVLANTTRQHPSFGAGNQPEACKK